MNRRLRWAILGTGKIANRFAPALNHLRDRAELLSIGATSSDKANAFGDKYGIPRRYVGVEEVVADPDVDIVYIGTPGRLHHDHVTQCLLAGKHVLCEKAFTINAAEALDLIELAHQERRFLMEGMWTRFFPLHVQIREMLKARVIGDVNGLIINFAAKPPFDLHNRFFDLNQGAGVLLDTGSYGISWAYSLLGKPDEVTGLAYFGETGADYRSAYILKYDRGPLVTITCCQTSFDVKDAVIFGSHGKIVVHDPWYKPTTMTVWVEGKEPQTLEFPLGEYNGYEYEACAVMDSIQAGKLECEVMPHHETISIMETMDALRSQWGFHYPFETVQV